MHAWTWRIRGHADRDGRSLLFKIEVTDEGAGGPDPGRLRLLASKKKKNELSGSIEKANSPCIGSACAFQSVTSILNPPTQGFTVAVSVVVGPNVMRQVQALHFTMPYGGDPLPQALPIFSTGTAFDVVVSVHSNRRQLLSVSGCGAYCGTPKTIVTAINAPAGLPVELDEGQVVAREYYGSMAITVPATSRSLALPGTAFFDDTQGHLSFFKQPSLTDPVSQALQIRNGERVRSAGH